MPKRSDLKSILILGSGPIVIGQACEFDYSGVQGCRALKEEGYRVILINSNPATIMTDPAFADATYIEPIEWRTITEIIKKEKPDAILPTLGGQTALNCALDLDRHGVLKQYNVEMIGATKDSIDKAEDRELFDIAMKKIGLETSRSKIAKNMDEAVSIQKELGFPVIIRPSYTMGGSGGGIAYNREELEQICTQGFSFSPTAELLLDESLLGWKEYELEVVRDKNDNCIVICTIENLDPMGVHTGDSITVAPAQTLTDKEYQRMRNASLAVLREIGIETGGANVQFAVNPKNQRLIVIEMNPRVSRSSALASKATGFPIAKVASKLAIGYTLDELTNSITKDQTPCSFEPTIDYVVTKIPRFAFEKYPHADETLTTQMKSVGEAMAIGRTFKESLQKALCSLETGLTGLNPQIEIHNIEQVELKSRFMQLLGTPTQHRILYVADAFRHGFSLDFIYDCSAISKWFLQHIAQIVALEKQLQQLKLSDLDSQSLFYIKQQGFSDARLAEILQVSEEDFRHHRLQHKVFPVFKKVDSCAAEFDTDTSYLYSTYERYSDYQPSDREKIVILGGGPNRIGQGIEFDYCCVHAAMGFKKSHYQSIMINCNPETVSTDYDISDVLYFEPITIETVLEIIRTEKPKGVVIQFGGQTPLKIANQLNQAGVVVLGTSTDAIDRAEDRKRFLDVVQKLHLQCPPSATVNSVEQALNATQKIGFPVMVRPSYVLGGRAMEIVFNDVELRTYFDSAIKVSHNAPVLIDKYLSNAIELDVDAICDGKDVLIGGIMQHIEQAGIHSGDSACSLPVYDLSKTLLDKVRHITTLLALELNVIGVINMQVACQDNEIYIIEVNPRASRTLPFVSKSIGISLAQIAAQVVLGKSLQQQGFTQEITPRYVCVKVPVFPFNKFPLTDPILGPEMKSTGEVMGIGETFAEAYEKAQLGAGYKIPTSGKVFISVKDADKHKIIELVKRLKKLGFQICASEGTQKIILEQGINCEMIHKLNTGQRPNIIDNIKNNELQFIINTCESRQSIVDSKHIRINAQSKNVYYTTTVSAAYAVVEALSRMNENHPIAVRTLQQFH